MSEQKRPYLDKTHPDIYKNMVRTAILSRKAANELGISQDLLELVNTRVSQINGCVACLSIHTEGARKAGVEQLKLDILPAWAESSLFSEREKMALYLAESLTRLDHQENRDSTIDHARTVFSDDEIAIIEWAVIIIGAFNRISIASGHPTITK